MTYRRDEHRRGNGKGEGYMSAGRDRTLLRSGRGRAGAAEQLASSWVCIGTIILRGAR
jgi:hypothetical protein